MKAAAQCTPVQASRQGRADLRQVSHNSLRQRFGRFEPQLPTVLVQPQVSSGVDDWFQYTPQQPVGGL